MQNKLNRYEQFGWDYEFLNPLEHREVAWYLDYARQSGGPVFELACGTGRLIVEIAKAGFQVYGIDFSQHMLSIAEKHVSKLPPEIALKIRLYRKDITDFQLDDKFGLAIIADNSFAQLQTRKQQSLCLKKIYEHLLPDGLLLMSVRRFNINDYNNGVRKINLTKPINKPGTPEQITRDGEIRLIRNRKRLRTTIHYKTTYEDGSEVVNNFISEAPVMNMNDYISLFNSCRFSSEVYADYEHKPADDHDRMLCFVCRKSE